jgi:hypothetical protein
MTLKFRITKNAGNRHRQSGKRSGARQMTRLQKARNARSETDCPKKAGQTNVTIMVKIIACHHVKSTSLHQTELVFFMAVTHVARTSLSAPVWQRLAFGDCIFIHVYDAPQFGKTGKT